MQTTALISRHQLLWALVVLTGLLYGADSKPSTRPPTFYKDVLPILQQHCQSCHRPNQIAPMPLVTYQQTRLWADAIRDTVRSKKMPPWFADPCCGHFSNDPSLTTQEITTLGAWADGDAPSGDPRDAPPPPQWTEGWNIAQPDLILSLIHI